MLRMVQPRRTKENVNETSNSLRKFTFWSKRVCTHSRCFVNYVLEGILGGPITARLASEQYGTPGVLCVDKDETNKLSLGPEALPHLFSLTTCCIGSVGSSLNSLYK